MRLSVRPGSEVTVRALDGGGLMGSRGPIPKRAGQRHGHRSRNEPPPDTAPGADQIEVPDPDPGWHPVAARWFESLADSGQAAFYEPSDWALAVLLAETMSRELADQPMVVGKGDATRIEWTRQPITGASLTALLKGMATLLVTEGDRRRVRLELTRRSTDTGEDLEQVAWIDDARRRLHSGQQGPS